MKAGKIYTEHELGILKALWGSEKPLTRLQILEQLAGADMNAASFHFSINNLIEKGYVNVAGFERCGTGYGRTYAAQKTQEEFVLELFRETRPTGTVAKGITDLMLAFVEKEPIDEATISEMEKMLAERRKKLQAEEENEKQKVRKMAMC